MSGPYPAMRGVPAAGHLHRGFWHPGRAEGCVKCPPKRLDPRTARPTAHRRYRFSPIAGPPDYRRGAGSIVTFVAAPGPPRRDLWRVRFPSGTEREVATRDLLSLQ